MARTRFAGSGGTELEDGRAVRRCLQLHGIAVALDLAGAAAGQGRDDLSFCLGAGTRCLFLGLDGPPAGGDKAVNGLQCRPVESAATGCRNGLCLGGRAAAAIGADDTLPGDGALSGHLRGSLGLESSCRLAEHFDEDGWASLDTM